MHHYAHHFLHTLSIAGYIALVALVMAALIFLGWSNNECDNNPWACNEWDPYAGNDDKEPS